MVSGWTQSMAGKVVSSFYFHARRSNWTLSTRTQHANDFCREAPFFVPYWLPEDIQRRQRLVSRDDDRESRPVPDAWNVVSQWASHGKVFKSLIVQSHRVFSFSLVGRRVAVEIQNEPTCYLATTSDETFGHFHFHDRNGGHFERHSQSRWIIIKKKGHFSRYPKQVFVYLASSWNK